MRKATITAALALLSITLLTSCRDAHKEERAGLLKRIADLDTEVVRLNERRAGALRAIESLPSEIKQFEASLQQHTQRRTKLQDDLADFVLDHKMATVALLATGGGAATFINDNIDEDTKTVLRLAGLFGLGYCVENASECADVTARVTYYGSQISSEENEVSRATSALNSKKSSLLASQQEYASLGEIIPAKTSERADLQRKHDSLVCRFCF